MAREEILYHYTTMDGLIGIVRDNCLWASSAFYLDDSEEIAAGFRRARNQLGRLKATASLFEKDRIDWLLGDNPTAGTVESKTVFVCSLSADGDRLSQWRAYCRGGGVAIGFPEDSLCNAISEQGFSLSKCVYTEQEHEDLIRGTIDVVAIPWIRAAEVPASEDEQRFQVSNFLSWELLRTSSRLKNYSFHEECESRIVSTPEYAYRAD